METFECKLGFFEILKRSITRKAIPKEMICYPLKEKRFILTIKTVHNKFRLIFNIAEKENIEKFLKWFKNATHDEKYIIKASDNFICGVFYKDITDFSVQEID